VTLALLDRLYREFPEDLQERALHQGIQYGFVLNGRHFTAQQWVVSAAFEHWLSLALTLYPDLASLPAANSTGTIGGLYTSSILSESN